MKKLYLVPNQCSVDLGLKGGVADGAGAIVGSGEGGAPGDAMVRDERDFEDNAWSGHASHSSVWEQGW